MSCYLPSCPYLRIVESSCLTLMPEQQVPQGTYGFSVLCDYFQEPWAVRGFLFPSRCLLPKHSLHAVREIFYHSHTTGSIQLAWHCTPMSLQLYLPRDSVPRLCPKQGWCQATLSAWQSSQKGRATPRSCHCSPLLLWQPWLALGTHSPAFAWQSKKPASWDENCL